jgi:hypothetical protein
MSTRFPIGSLLAAAAGLILVPGVSAAASSDWTPLFDGQSLRQWKANEHPGTFKIVDGVIVAKGERAHLFYVGDGDAGADFKNFELEAEVLAKPGANSGIFFHTAYQATGWPDQGFEVQINNSQAQHGDYLELKKTGSLYGVRNVYRAMARDNEWFTLRISVRAQRVQVRLNDLLLVDYVEPAMPGADRHRRRSKGTFALQGHDPDSEVHFRNLRVKRLPDDLTDPAPAAAYDGIAQDILKLGDANFPLIDFHTHLKGGLVLEDVLDRMRATGINAGIAVNGGVGFPITNEAGIEAFRQSMQGTPCFIALQAEGREWPTLFSREAIAKFDYVFTDAMTIPDLRGKRTRLWVRDEVQIPDKQAFMDHLVTNIVGILDHEPIDIYVNATYLPDAIAAEYDALWTPERMDRVITAAKRNGVAIEIGARFKIPSAAFIKRAKQSGLKFTLGTNNGGRDDLGRLEYALQMVKECELGWKDMWMPKPEGQKPVQVKATARLRRNRSR